MALVSLNCPNCSGSIQMDNALEKGFCMYCGTSFLVKDEIQRVQVEHSGTVNLNLNREIEVENLLIRAEQKIEEYKSQGYRIDYYYSKIVNDYLEKALDINPKSTRVQEMRNKLIIEKNELIEENKVSDKREWRNEMIAVYIIVGFIALSVLIAFCFSF